MKKLSENKPKHNHNFTDWLKFILFAILMLAPIFSIATRCLYVICNKNAKDSYYGETINEEITNVLNENKFNTQTRYTFNSASYNDIIGLDFGLSGNRLTFLNPSIVYYNGEEDLTDLSQIALSKHNYINSDFYILVLFDSDGNQIVNKFSYERTLVFEFDYISNNLEADTFTQEFFTYKTYNNYSFLDNAFDYSISQLEQSNTFTWTKQTATYEVFNNMLTGLTIQNGILPLLLTYWMMIIVVYIIVDIIIKTFTFITHLING